MDMRKLPCPTPCRGHGSHTHHPPSSPPPSGEITAAHPAAQAPNPYVIPRRCHCEYIRTRPHVCCTEINRHTDTVALHFHATHVILCLFFVCYLFPQLTLFFDTNTSQSLNVIILNVWVFKHNFKYWSKVYLLMFRVKRGSAASVFSPNVDLRCASAHGLHCKLRLSCTEKLNWRSKPVSHSREMSSHHMTFTVIWLSSSRPLVHQILSLQLVPI